MQEQDIQLAARCARLAEQSRHAATWLADNRETVGSECTTLQKEMRRAARFFGKCEQAARRKMCVGVFGPSQSGKSYLISALARDSRGDLLADFCGRTSDFITEINPEGGKESTGLVTRFTTTPPQGLTPDFPIRLRLLSEMDVVRVLANTYYADCEHKQMPDADAMRSALERLTQTARQSSPGASSVTADDVEDLREYLNRNFLSKPRVQMLQQGYWAQAVSLAPLLPLSYRAELFGIIWNNQPKFQQLFLELCQALEALGNPAEADCPLEALLPRQTSIIDVALLAGLGTHSAEDRLTLLGKDGRKAALPRAVVTALTAEITIFMREQPDDFFSYTDLLDFPGYRSRLKILDLDKELEREGALQNLFLRGKVAYLFERYCEEHELTSMLLCIGPGNQEVQDLPAPCTTGSAPPTARTRPTVPARPLPCSSCSPRWTWSSRKKLARLPWNSAGTRAFSPPCWTFSASSMTGPPTGTARIPSATSSCCATPISVARPSSPSMPRATRAVSVPTRSPMWKKCAELLWIRRWCVAMWTTPKPSGRRP